MRTLNTKYLIAVIFMLLIVFQSIAQISICGVVKTSQGRVVDLANIVVYPIDSPKTILSSALTDENGRFNMTVKSNCDSLLLKASSLEMATAIIKIPNQSGNYDIIVEEQTIELKEVVVKSKKIYSQGDTINYNVASFLSKNDQALADVLKKMPGITVAESGQVAYQGKPIKNFYIEGLDLMKGHYGIATNNLDPNNIATVQVLEHHQDIKALKGLRPEERASINIRLKEGVKGVFNLIVTLGGGHSNEPLWTTSAMATYFRRNSQFLTTYKGNNTGYDLSNELYAFDNDYTRTNNISSITMPSVPGISKQFYYFNRSHSSTFNNVYRIGKSGEFGINAAYFNDRDTRQSRSTTINFLPDNIQNILIESMDGTARTQKAYGDITYMNNGNENYLKEQLKFDWSKDNTNSNIIAEGDKVSQSGKTDIYRMLNKFHITHRNSKDQGFEISSIINMERRPHSLCVSPNLFPEVVFDDMLSQYVTLKNISTENTVGLLSVFKLGNLTFHPSAIVNYNRNSLESQLESIENNLTLDYLDTGIGTEMMLNTRKLYVSLFLPVKYKLFRLKNRLNDDIKYKHCFRVEPTFNFTYKFNSSHNLNIKASIGYMTPSIETLYSSYILTSYRQLSVYDVNGLYEGTSQFYSLGYDFKNILSMSFAGVELSWNHQAPEVLYGSYFDNIVQRTISQRTSEEGNIVSAKIHAIQGFDWHRLKIGASIEYSHYNNPFLIQDKVLRYSGKAIIANTDISLTPFKCLGISYQGNYAQSVSQQKGFDSFPWIRTITNSATLNFTLPKGVTLQTSIYHYYNNFNNGDKSFLLFNAEARYTIKRFTFTLSADNLLNRRKYLYSSHSALTESNSVYSIRPRTLLLKIRLRIF